MVPASKMLGVRRDPRWRGLAAGLGLALAVAFLASGVWHCPFAASFGIPCPACGSTRAIWALVHGDGAAVLRGNPVAPLVVVLLGIIAARIVWLEGTRGHSRDLVAAPYAWLVVRALPVVLTIELVVWALRLAGFLGGPVSLGLAS